MHTAVVPSHMYILAYLRSIAEAIVEINHSCASCGDFNNDLSGKSQEQSQLEIYSMLKIICIFKKILKNVILCNIKHDLWETKEDNDT